MRRGLTVLWLLSCACPGPAPKLSAIQQDILTPTCVFSACHGSSSPMRALTLTDGKTWASIVNRDSSQPGLKLVVPGDPERSLLYSALRGLAPNTRKMPLGGSLTDAELHELRDWIAAGAKDD